MLRDGDATVEPLVLSTRAGGVATLTLNRPAAMNSFTTPMVAELLAALEAVAADAAVRCVVITGSGRGFCAGQDLNDPAAAPGRDLGDLIRATYVPLAGRIRSMPVPVVAAVNGVAAGAGANLALGCDLVIAARSASFIQAFAKIGLVVDAGGSWLLPRLVGNARALGLALLGDKLGAAEAAQMGLIWQCVDDAAFAGTVAATAERLSLMPTRALVATRQAFAAAQASSFEAALHHEAGLQSTFGAAPDYFEGVEAFRGKRAPRFSDR